MKVPFVLLALLAAPSLVQAQSAPVVVAKAPKEPLPKARELFDNLFAPYAAAKTYRGNFDIVLSGNEDTAPISEIHLQAKHRMNDKGDMESQDTTLGFVSRADAKQQPTLRFVRNGRAGFLVLTSQKMWWSPEPSDNVDLPVLSAVLKPLLDGVTQAINQMPGFVPIISKGKEAGRPVFILKAEGTNVLRVVVDAQTRALRSFELKDSLSIRGSNQTFDESIADAEFTWTPPADFKQVALDEIALPPFLKATVNGQSAKPTPAD